MRRSILSILILLSISTCCTRTPILVSRIVSEGGKPCLEVDGQPFPIYGAQIRIDIFRNCDYMDWGDIEAYFVKAVELGVNTVELSHTWRMVEPEMDRYEFSTIDHLLTMASGHGLKVELLWFGSNMIGDSYSFFIPDYILRQKRLHLLRDDDGRPTRLYGYDHILYLDDPWLMERECKAVRALFDHIYAWDRKHGRTHPVITCQIENEPDGGVRWRMDQQAFRHRDSTLLTKEEMWKMTLASLDAVGQSVQGSLYKVATRTNLIFGDNVRPFPQAPCAKPGDVLALSGIDFVSVDPYKETVDELVDNVAGYASLAGNYPLVAENRGHYANTPGLMLAASAVGGGYCIYDLATSPYITSHSTPPFDSEGVYESDLTEKPHTADVKVMLRGLVAAGSELARTPLEDFAAFNIRTDYPAQEIVQTVCTTGAEIEFRTEAGALAFALDRGDHLILYATAPAVFSIRNGKLEGREGPIETDGSELVDLGFRSDGKINSTTRKLIGTYYFMNDEEE